MSSCDSSIPGLGRELEADLIQRVLRVIREGQAQCEPQAALGDPAVYVGAPQLEAEVERVFRRYPLCLAHASALPSPGSFITSDITGVPLIITRGRGRGGKPGAVRAYVNACRHRGTRLTGATADTASGTRTGRWVCPYHGWQFQASDGRLAKVTDAYGFPGVDADTAGGLGLVRVACAERHGFLWLCLDGLDDAAHRASLAAARAAAGGDTDRCSSGGGDAIATTVASVEDVAEACDAADAALAASLDAFLGDDLVRDFQSLQLDRQVEYVSDFEALRRRGVPEHTGPHSLTDGGGGGGGGEAAGQAAAGRVGLRPPASGSRGQTAFTRELNWKLAFDVFLEAYHLKYAHAKSIYPVFLDNVAVFERLHGAWKQPPAPAPARTIASPTSAAAGAGAGAGAGSSSGASEGTTRAPTSLAVSHMRNLFPKRAIAELEGSEAAAYPPLRAVSNVLYYVWPNTLLLVQPDHVTVNHVYPRGPGACAISLSMLIDGGDACARGAGAAAATAGGEERDRQVDGGDGGGGGGGYGGDGAAAAPPRAERESASESVSERERRAAYWDKNLEIFVNATFEDFALGEGAQVGIDARAAPALLFGRFEQSLHWFHEGVRRATRGGDNGHSRGSEP